jgi:hypothetical protein
MSPAQLKRFLASLPIAAAALLVAAWAIVRWMVPDVGFVQYVRGWAIGGVAVLAVLWAMSWFVGGSGPIEGPVDAVLFLLLFPLVGLPLFPVVVMAGSKRSYRSNLTNPR